MKLIAYTPEHIQHVLQNLYQAPYVAVRDVIDILENKRAVVEVPEPTSDSSSSQPAESQTGSQMQPKPIPLPPSLELTE